VVGNFSCLFAWFGDLDTGDMAEPTRALLALIIPIPLLVPFYWLLVKAARKAERGRSKA
jgi:hypothetical protein